MFVPPINLGQFQPSPATLADWIYQIWNYLQNNPIATQEQLQEYIATFITTSPETQELIGEGVEQYLTDNPPPAPVQSVQGKTGAVQLAYNDIVTSSNAVPVYKAASTPSTSTLVGQYNIGYRLFVNTATQEIYTISPAGALSLVGRGKFDGTDIDLDTEQGDTTIAEAVSDLDTKLSTIGTVETLLTFGSYSQDSGVITLSNSYTNYDLICIRLGRDTSDGSGGGAYLHWLHPDIAGFTSHLGTLFFDGTNLYNVVITFPTTTSVKVTASYNVTSGSNASNYNGLRSIYGIKLTA